MKEIHFRASEIAAQARLLGLNRRAPGGPVRFVPLAHDIRTFDAGRQNLPSGAPTITTLPAIRAGTQNEVPRLVQAMADQPAADQNAERKNEPFAPPGPVKTGLEPRRPTDTERRAISPTEAARESLRQFFIEHGPESEEARAVRDRLLYEKAKAQGRIFMVNESGMTRFSAYRESIAADYPGQYTDRELLALLSFTAFEDILPEVNTPRTRYADTLLTIARDLLGNYASAVQESEIEGSTDTARERQRNQIAVDNMQSDMEAWVDLPFSPIEGMERNIAKLSAREIPEVPVIIGENHGQEITIGEHIGNGNSGKVFEATMDGQEFAIKLPLIVIPDCVDEFSDEAALLSAIDNPHVTSFVQFDTMRLPRGRILPYILMEKAEGTLEQVMDGNPLPTEEVLRLTVHTADAYAAIYENGLFFPAPGLDDVLLFRDAQGEAVWKLADFGGAMLAAHARFAKHPEADAQEVWATKILYPAVTGINIASSEIPSFESLVGSENMTEYHRVLEEVLIKATQKDPKDQYPSMTALRDDLQAKIAAAEKQIEQR